MAQEAENAAEMQADKVARQATQAKDSTANAVGAAGLANAKEDVKKKRLSVPGKQQLKQLQILLRASLKRLAINSKKLNQSLKIKHS